MFADAGRPYQALDSLPLAAEPFAGALDVVFAFVVAAANRASTIDLLSSPHWRFPELEGALVSVKARVNALDARLRELKYFGGWDRLAALAGQAAFATDGAGATQATRPARAAGRAPMRGGAPRRGRRRRGAAAVARGADRVGAAPRPARFRQDPRARRPKPATPGRRGTSARAPRSIGALESLAEAHARHDDAPLAVDRLAGAVRRWIEGQTFSPRTGPHGMLLLDAPAAAYADVDEMRLVGLVELDWPERVRRSIFYPASLLSQLGWPNETDRLAAARARFHDLLRLPRRRVSVSTFTLEDDAIVSGSSFLQELETSGLPIERPDELGQNRARVAALSPRRGARKRTRGSSCAPGGRRRTATSTTARRGRAPRRSTPSVRSSATSRVRSSTSRRACCASTRSGTTSPA